jgi:D-arabinose 1-dehydrogenase-like Zn-dependent alcohol dehydrogenase
VQACGICHSDSYTKEGLLPIEYPRVPGHGGNCGYCDGCRRGNLFACQSFTAITGITSDGGYAEYMIARSEALALVPDELSAVEAAPLVCAGVTTFNCLRNSGARPGDLVAVLGLGGRHYIDSQAQDPAAALRDLGGAALVLATVTNSDAMAAVLGGRGANGTFMLIGATPSLTVSPVQLLRGRQSVKGWYSGTSIDSQDTMAFSVLSAVRSRNEIFPLERAAEGYERMMSGKARFRAVLSIGS